ncbi:L,D-transpeptidase family protein [Ensifer sp. 4252]|uniref:L,D-transpeptidase family protein n=1 Tax=Ensifer sp. 4252 TaxID=3373915 RepID=UPI003D20D40A
MRAGTRLKRMNRDIFVAALTVSTLICGPASSSELLPETINAASLGSIPTAATSSTSPANPDPAIVQLQVLLDRAGSSPGVIDGYFGENVSKAVAGFEAMNGLPSDGKLDPEVIARLNNSSPVVQSYKITTDDKADLVQTIPEDYGEKAQMDHLGYTSVAEKLSERFHMDIDLLKALNPQASFAVGETISVTIPGPFKTGKVKRIEANRRTAHLYAYGDDGILLAVYPATIGSSESPAPSGRHKVKGVARMPTYIYNPRINFKQGDNTKVLTIPGGPNGPVGTVWIDLSKPTYGIHGTPEPALIDKVGSHGCVRLANWDVEELAAMVEPGVSVEFVE